MTGRGLGYCGGYGMPGYMNPVGYGRGRGYGRGFWGRGRGLGRGWDRAWWGDIPDMGYAWPPVGPYYAGPDVGATPADERTYLEGLAKRLEEQLEAIRKRIAGLSK